jgi:hypothetical protein
LLDWIAHLEASLVFFDSSYCVLSCYLGYFILWSLLLSWVPQLVSYLVILGISSCGLSCYLGFLILWPLLLSWNAHLLVSLVIYERSSCGLSCYFGSLRWMKKERSNWHWWSWCSWFLQFHFLSIWYLMLTLYIYNLGLIYF